jgi:hypothetical protein
LLESVCEYSDLVIFVVCLGEAVDIRGGGNANSCMGHEKIAAVARRTLAPPINRKGNLIPDLAMMVLLEGTIINGIVLLLVVLSIIYQFN